MFPKSFPDAQRTQGRGRGDEHGSGPRDGATGKTRLDNSAVSCPTLPHLLCPDVVQPATVNLLRAWKGRSPDWEGWSPDVHRKLEHVVMAEQGGAAPLPQHLLGTSFEPSSVIQRTKGLRDTASRPMHAHPSLRVGVA